MRSELPVTMVPSTGLTAQQSILPICPRKVASSLPLVVSHSFRVLSPLAVCVWCLVAGAVLVLLFTAARLRYPWWPLHPLMFALWATGHIRHFAGAFFLGWVIKVLVTKYGGTRLYGRLKPLMIGLIAGEILGAVLPCIVGAIYYACTGEPP